MFSCTLVLNRYACPCVPTPTPVHVCVCALQLEISKVHGNLSEEAYKAQATQVMRSGPPSKASNQMLEQLAQQLGLGKDAAEKVNKVGGGRGRQGWGEASKVDGRGRLTRWAKACGCGAGCASTKREG